MFRFLRRRSSQISSQTILESGIGKMVAQRDHHLSMMNQLETIIAEATRAYDQHTRLYDALNNSLFTINHPFDPVSEELAEALANADFDADLSVDQPSDGERLDAIPPRTVHETAEIARALPAEVAVRNATEALAMAGVEMPPVIPLRGGKRRKATAAEAAE